MKYREWCMIFVITYVNIVMVNGILENGVNMLPCVVYSVMV